MITEQQKHLIFDINCFYQLESQKNKLALGQPIAFLPELAILGMSANSKGEKIDWAKKHQELYQKLKLHGLTENWINTLQKQIDLYLSRDGTVETFREEFLSAIDMLTNMIISIIRSAPSTTPKKYISEKVIGDIFDKDYWEGPVIEQINKVRTLSTRLGFSKEFVIEFGNTIAEKN